MRHNRLTRKAKYYQKLTGKLVIRGKLTYIRAFNPPCFIMVYKILTVAGLATFEIYAAIPAGFAFQLSPWVIFFASLIGGLVGVYVAAFLGDKIRAFFHRNKPVKEEKPRTGIIYRIWDKYGVIGLGYLGTMTVGAPVSIAVGVGFKVPLRRLITWCCLGVLTRCALFTIIGYFGLKLL